MGYGTVVASAILFTLVIVLVAFIAVLLLDITNVVMSSARTVLKSVRRASAVNLEITSIRYDNSSNTLYINVTNTGSESVILGPRYDLLIDYYDTNSTRRIELYRYGEWQVVEVFVRNSTLTTGGAAVELYPGCTAQISVNPSKPILPGSIVIVVLVSPTGEVARYATGV